MTQQARNLCMELGEHPSMVRFLIGDRYTKFTASSDAVFAAETIRLIKTPIRAPRANTVCERVIGTLRRERLDRRLILGRRHLEAVFFAPSITTRTNRTGPSAAPDPTPVLVGEVNSEQLRWSDVLGGLVHEYRMIA